MNLQQKGQYKPHHMIFLFWLLFLTLSCNSPSPIIVADLKCEYKTNPQGIDNIEPRLSWKIIDESQKRGQKQTAYQILVASSLDILNDNDGDVWNSGKVESGQSVNNVFRGISLESATKYFWKVKVWDISGNASDWSKAASYTMGLLGQDEWTGEWIYKEDQKKTDHNWYRKNFKLDEEPSSALVFVASFGYHELYVNGEKITDGVLNPVASYMKRRIPYLTYDISNVLREGDNVIAIWHAAGWARWNRIREYRNPPFVLKAQAEILTASNKLTISTDESWKCKKSYTEYYGNWDILDFGGETIDDRYREDDWNRHDYDDSSWSQALVYDAEMLNAKNKEVEVTLNINSQKQIKVKTRFNDITARLSPQLVEPQVKFKEVKPIAIKDNEDGTYRIDMGENYTGFFEMALYGGNEGDSVLFEISDQTEKVMNWKQKSKYIYGDSGEGRFANRFNVAGGRWVTVYGLTYEPKLDDIRGYVITNDRKQISKFECSNEQLNQIYEINLNTYLANTLDGILMDCPHRERRGWGEVTVAAMYGDALPNFESGAYMDQYTQFMRDAQFEDGKIRAVINEEDRPFLMWKANNPITVWETFRTFGDKKILEDNYESMNKWMEWLYQNSDYDIGGPLIAGKRGAREFPGLGDWCTPRGNFWTSSNSPNAIHFNNCLYAFMLDNAMKISTALGKSENAKMYEERLSVQRNATHKLSYNSETGQYAEGLQVSQAFALLAGVTPESEREKVYGNLVNNVLYEFPYYDTGSSGQALYTRYFTESGERMDLIYELLQDKHHPGYGYFVEQGETTWPERWSSVGGSKIHTCYTGIGGYFIKGFGGIRTDPVNPGMQNMVIKPAPVSDLTYANTEYQSMYGNVVVNWKRQNGGASFHIEIPGNTTAAVYLPAINKESVKEGNILAENAEGVSYAGTEQNDAVGNYVIYKVESGTYDFTVSTLPETVYPDPMGDLSNLALLGRMSASSMFIETEKLPGFEAFKANDENEETRWLSAESKDQYLEVSWVKPQTFNKVIIDEFGTQISSYKIQYWDKGEWKDIVSGSECGPDKAHSFDSITSTKCRVLIVDAKDPPSIAELNIHMTKSEK